MISAERGYYDLLEFLITSGAKVCFTDIKKQSVSRMSTVDSLPLYEYIVDLTLRLLNLLQISQPS